MNISTVSHFQRLLWCCGTLASAATLLAAPPKVVKAVPDNQATGVDPDLRELRIEFDQPMSQGGWSVVGGGPTYPKMVGKARWVDERTFTWSWRLEPEHEYWFGINSPSFKNFRSESGEPAEPYPVGFTTGKRTGAAATNAAARQLALNREAVVHLKRSLDEDYSYRDLRQTNWAERFAQFRPQLETNCSPRQFAQTAAELLSAAQDIHLWLQVNGETIPTWKRQAVWNVAGNRLPRFVPRWQQRSAMVCTGQFGDGIRYLFLRAWPADAREALEPAYAVLADAAEAGQPLIIDVRANGGGSEDLAAEFAGCFLDQPAVYAKDVIRRAGQFSGPFERTVQPNRARPKYRGKVAVLAGAGTVSSCESFVMMMKQVPGCTLVGEPTAGCSGNPRPVDLGNEVTVFFPSWKDLDLEGNCLEGKGFAPSVAVKTSPEDFNNSDPVLEAALKLLRQK